MPPRRKARKESIEENIGDGLLDSPESEEDDEDIPRSSRRTRNRKNESSVKFKTKTETIEPPPIVDTNEQNEGNIEFNEDEDLLNFTIPPKPDDYKSDPARYRLMIQKIDVENFKSYHGQQTLGPFHKNLTMILGPNGSGKSNVIDALLFVFGFRSNKIRSKKLSSLIHTSAAIGNQRCRYCKVEIYFHMIRDVDEDRYCVRPNTRFSVGRTAFLDNSSKYTINGQNASYKDVEELLKKSGIDLIHNRFLILQGEVEAIAMMKPRALNPGEEGMLEYIEDLVGSNRLVPFIRKLEHRVASLECVSSQQSLRVRETERVKKEMEPDVKHAQRFMNSQNESAILQSKLLQIDRYRFTMEKKPLEVEIREKEAEMKEMEARRKQLNTEIKEIEATELENSNEQDRIHEEIESYLQEIRDAEQAEMRRKTNLKKCTNELVRLHKDLDTETKLCTEIEAIPEKAKKRIEMLSEESKELLEKQERDLKASTDNLVKFERKSMEERARKEAYDAEYARTNAILNEIKTKETVAQAELDDLKEISIRDKRKLEDLRKSLEEVERKYEFEKKEYIDLKRGLPQQERTLRDTQVELPHVRKMEADLRTKVSELRDKYEEKTFGYQTLLRGSKVHNALLNAKATGTLPGLLGRLGDLGAIDELYDAAISTTCPQLDWYVVETSNDGQQAIDYLIECSLPRCSFMCIDQSIKSDAGMNRNRNEFPAPRLFDLLRVTDIRIRRIFYQCVGDMLVVPTLLDAQKIDREYQGKYRIVTYEGNTIERTGAVSGGGRPLTGRIGRDIRAPPSEEMQKEFRSTAAEYDSTTAEHQEMYARLQHLELQLSDLTKTVHGMKEALKRHEAALPPQAEAIESLKRRIAEQEKEAAKEKVSKKEIEEKEAELQVLSKEREDANSLALAAKSKVDKSAEKIDEMFNELVQKFKDRAKTSKERYDDVEQEIAKEQASIVNSQHNLVTAKKNILNIQELLMKKRIECDALSSAEADGKEVFTLHELTRNRKKKLTILRDAATDLRKKRQELDEEEREHVKKIGDARDLLDSMNQSLDDIELQLESITRKISLLRIRKVPDFRKYEKVKISHDFGWICLEPDEHDDELNKDAENDENNQSDSEIDEIPVLTDAEIEEISRSEKDKIRMDLRSIEKFMESNRQNTDERIFGEYLNKAKLYIAEVRKLETIGEQLSIHKKKLGELRSLRLDEFGDALAFLSATTQMLYQLITNGGDASLSFVEGKSADPFDAGVKFSVRPAKKSWKLIENLSGGEKTLASLCFVFAMHHYRSTPLYVMDEIDAALDTQNVRLIANYIKNSDRTRNAQFIIISLRNQMFEMGNRLIGVYKTNDCTHHVVISPSNLKKASALAGQVLKNKAKEERNGTNAAESVTNVLSAEMQRINIATNPPIRRKALFLPSLNEDPRIPASKFICAPTKSGDADDTIQYPSTSAEDHVECQENKIDPANMFNFDEDDAPIRKRRRRTVRDEEDDEDDEEETGDNANVTIDDTNRIADELDNENDEMMSELPQNEPVPSTSDPPPHTHRRRSTRLVTR